MELFIDSAKIEEIGKVRKWGILDGVTTNPSLIKKAVSDLRKKNKKIDMEDYIISIIKSAGKKTPVSLEVIGSDYEEMVKEGFILYKKFKKYGNVYIKIPVNPCLEEKCSMQSDGIRAIKTLTKKGIKVNCTLIFTPEQALLAAKAGANYVSPFIGREDDYIRHLGRIKFEKEDYYPSKGKKKLGKMINDKGIVSGVDLVSEIKKIFLKHKIKSKVLAASIRNQRSFRESVLAGADIVTLPYNIIERLLQHPETAEGMTKFTEDVVPEYAQMIGICKTPGYKRLKKEWCE
jgi:transaldolase